MGQAPELAPRRGAGAYGASGHWRMDSVEWAVNGHIEEGPEARREALHDLGGAGLTMSWHALLGKIPHNGE